MSEEYKLCKRASDAITRFAPLVARALAPLPVWLAPSLLLGRSSSSSTPLFWALDMRVRNVYWEYLV